MAVFVKEYDWMWLPTGLNLSPAECRVYAYIYGLTESKYSKTKGYNGTVRQLANDLGLDHGGVSRILHKLQNDNRIRLTNGVYRSVDLITGSGDTITNGGDIITDNGDTITESGDSVTPLNNPLYKENKERENREEITREENFDASLSPQEDLFIVTLAAFRLQAGARNVTDKQEQNALTAWKRYTPEQQQSLLDAIHNGYNKKGNFQFTVEDFLREQADTTGDKQAAPINYNGCDPPKNVPTAVAYYNGEWGLYTHADIRKFNLKTKSNSLTA